MTTADERLARLEASNLHLATKADVSDLRAEMHQLNGRLETQIANLRAEMHRINSTLLKWIVGFMLTSVSTGLAAILINLLD